MKSLHEMLLSTYWSTPKARNAAGKLLQAANRPAVLRALVAALFDNDPLLRNCAANVARCMTDRQSGVLSAFADELIGLLAATPLEDYWGRCYLGLVAARSAADQRQRLRAAELMRRLAEDPQNVVRCTAIEGFAHLALAEPSLREEARSMLEDARHNGTPAMRARARRMLKLTQRRRTLRDESQSV